MFHADLRYVCTPEMIFARYRQIPYQIWIYSVL